MAWATVPGLLQIWELMEVTSHPDTEIRIPDFIYHRIPPIDFSRHILTLAPESLLALRLENVKWSDLGEPSRVLATLLEKNGDLPVWAKLWSEPESTPRVATATG
jgi:hypothetical protein